jgi:hypothetical protein
MFAWTRAQKTKMPDHRELLIAFFHRILKPNSLYEMRYKRNEANKDWLTFLNILSKQKNVTFLELEGNKVQKFPDTPEKWDLKKLQKLFLQKLKFPVPAAFQNFTRFIKTLDKITDLNLDVMEDKTEFVKFERQSWCLEVDFYAI